jgi:hypothetical protein
VTTGSEVLGSGVALFVFSLVGLLFVHAVLSAANGAMGAPAWHQHRRHRFPTPELDRRPFSRSSWCQRC